MAKAKFDPDDVRMSFGAHLEELRRRIMLSLLGVLLVSILTLWYGRTLVAWLCQPLRVVQRQLRVPDTVYNFSAVAPFSVYMKVGLVAALIIAAPWVVYQIWQFVSVGLYEGERRVMVLLAPLSVLLTVFSMAFFYFLFLPAALVFLLAFSVSYPDSDAPGTGLLHWTTKVLLDANTATFPGLTPQVIDPSKIAISTTQADRPPIIPSYTTDPDKPEEGMLWFNRSKQQLLLFQDGQTRTITMSAGALMQPMIGINEYLGFATILAIVVAVMFQLPVVMAMIGASGLIDPGWLGRSRKYVLFGCFVAGIFVTPNQDLFSNILLPLLMYGLFEFGLILMRPLYRRHMAEVAAEEEEVGAGKKD